MIDYSILMKHYPISADHSCIFIIIMVPYDTMGLAMVGAEAVAGVAVVVEGVGALIVRI